MIPLAIIGGGPAGLAAAAAAAALGVETTLFDDQPTPGGQVYRGIGEGSDFALLGEEYRAALPLLAAFQASGAAYEPGCVVWQARSDGMLGLLRDGAARLVPAERIIIATGAMERPVPVPGWTLPGVMSAGAAQTLLKSAGAVPDVPVVIVGSGPLIYLIACQLARAGASIAAVLVTTPRAQFAGLLRELPRLLRAGSDLAPGIAWIAELRRRGIRTETGVTGLAIDGAAQAESVRFSLRGRADRIEAGLVLLHEGVIPRTDLTEAALCRHRWNAGQHAWEPETDDWGATSRTRLAVAGDGAGILGGAAAQARGRLAAYDAAHRLGRIDQATRDRLAAPDRAALARHARIRPVLDRLFFPSILAPEDDNTIVCRCEEVTAGALRAAIPTGGGDPNLAKVFTRCGMGPCQGRSCGPVVAEIIARATGRSLESVGSYRIRPPVRPVPLASLATMAGAEDADRAEGAEGAGAMIDHG